MTSNAAGCPQLIVFCTFQGAGRGVIDDYPAMKPFLEGVGAFAEIMGKANQSALCFRTKSTRKVCAELSGMLQVF